MAGMHCTGGARPRWYSALRPAFLLAALVGTVLVGGSAAAGPGAQVGRDGEAILVTARVLAGFDRVNASKRRFGKLEWRGGLELTSPHRSFGGWSGLIVDPKGERMLAISDDGHWLTARLSYRAGRLVGLTETRLGPLLSTSGKPLRGKRERDAEGLALFSGGFERGEALISFERYHRIGRFPLRRGIPGKPTGYLKLPAEIRRLGSNKGLEGVAVLQAGRYRGWVAAFAERPRSGKGPRQVWLLQGKRALAFHITDRGDMDVSDAAALPDGGLVILERRFRWSEGLNIRVRRIRAAEIAAGATIAGETLLEASLGHEIDNMEGIAVHRGARGEIVLTLISDDNYNRLLQRTVLLQFAIADTIKATSR